MQLRRDEFERIRTVFAETEVEEPLTAREIHDLLEARGEGFDSPHRVATVLGRRADTVEVEVIKSHPYRYRVSESS